MKSMKHRDEPLQSPGGHVLVHLGLDSGRLGPSLKQHIVPYNRATCPKGAQWESGLAASPAGEKSVQSHPGIRNQSL